MARKWDFDCIVVGGGPGGLVSAIYLRRFCRSVALINSAEPRAMWIPRTRNLIGYDQGITGRELMRRLSLQLHKHGCERFRASAATRRIPGGFEVTCGREKIRSSQIIFATGIRDELPKLRAFRKLKCSPLIGLCPICDGYEHRGSSFAVLAQNSAGIRKALFTKAYARKLTIVLPSEFKISPSLTARISRASAQVVRANLIGLDPGPRKKGISLRLAGAEPVHADVVYCELGSAVNKSAFANLRGLRYSASGRLRTTSEQRLPIPGAFAVGDCTDALSQLAVAAAQGAVAATCAHNDLR